MMHNVGTPRRGYPIPMQDGQLAIYLSITPAITTAKLMERRVMPRPYRADEFALDHIIVEHGSFSLQLSRRYSA